MIYSQGSNVRAKLDLWPDDDRYEGICFTAAWQHEAGDHAGHLLASRSGALLRRAFFLAPELRLPDDEDDDFAGLAPDSTHGQAIIEQMTRVAASLSEVRLLIVDLNGFPDCQLKYNSPDVANWTWRIHHGGLGPWLSIDFVCALYRWLEVESELARFAIEEWLAAQKRTEATRTTILMVEMILASRVDSSAASGPSIDRYLLQPLPRILAAGGKRQQFVPLT